MPEVQRRSYKITPIVVNRIEVSEVIIDPHYEKRHGSYLDDQKILELILELDGRIFLPEGRQGKFSYFTALLELDEKSFRLVWLLEDGALYIGVVNAYRDRRKNHGLSE